MTVFGVCGACRGDELTNILVDQVTVTNNEIIVRIPDTKTRVPKVFPINGAFADIVRRYIALRPAVQMTNRFFILYRGGKCANQPIGKNTISQMPRKIAEFLGLPNSVLFTGHSFRRTSTTILADQGAPLETIKRHGPWKSGAVAEGKTES